MFYQYVTAYVYNSVIVPTAPSASIGYLQGYQTGGVWYNSSLIVDTSSVQQKSGLSNTYVYLAEPNSNATVAIYRNTFLGSLIAPAGLRSTSCTKYATYYGEFSNTGPGALTASNSASRSAVCDRALTADQMSAFSIDQVFGRAFPGYSSFDTTWVPSSLVKAIKDSDASQVASASTTANVASSASTSSASTSASSASSISASSSSSSALSASSDTVSASSAMSSSSSISSSSTSSMASISSGSSQSVSSTQSSAISVVTVAPTSAQFSDINSAALFAQNSGIPSISVLAGTYGPVTVAGTQTLTISGPFATAVSDNQVVITSNGAGGSVSFGTANGRGLTLRNLNITNTASSGVGPAVNAKGVNLGIYTCALVSSAQGVYQATYGFTLVADSLIQGTDKLFYNYPTVYVYRSTIIPTASGSSIFYGKGIANSGVNYNATLVVDSSSVQGTASNVYLATPNGAAGLINVIYRGSSLGSLIAKSGVYSTACTAPGSIFGEFQNTDAGSYSSNAASRGAASCDYLLSADQVSAYNISSVFGNAYAGYASSDTAWIDQTILNSIRDSDAAQLASASAIASPTSTSSTATSSATSTASSCVSPVPSATLVVSQNATGCSYANISAAISALPNDNQPYTIKIEPGTYEEQISITRNGKVTLIGETSNPEDYSQNTVRVQFSRGELTSAGKNEQTPVLNVKKTGSQPDFAAYNIDFVNTYPQTVNTAALAADFYGTNFAAYGCSFIGFQDTLLANKGAQVFANCYIEGSIDFCWGFGTAYFYRSVLSSNTRGFVAAQGRVAGTTAAYVYDECKITYKESTYGSTLGTTYLGRPYSSYSTVVYKNSYLDQHINPAGWSIWSTSSPQTSNVVFGEFNNTGPSSWQAGSGRASFATNMTSEQVAVYSLSNVIGDTSFIDQKAWNYPAPFEVSSSPTTDGSEDSTSTSRPTATASINAHPESGSIPPQFAVLVSPNAEVNGSYSNITAALASLPNDNTNQTIFIYAGSYSEQVPSINRPGAVRLIGYTTANPGQSYKDNKVTVSFSRGLSVSPLPVGHSNSETAVMSTASNGISFYNINIKNTDNMDGSQASYVTLAASLYGNKIGFYACSFDGWQDTLLTGATAGYQYYESCYIGGAIDFIYGYSMAYFKGCTIGAKRASSAITAQSRASSAAIGGYVFDQCLFNSAPDATVDLTGRVYLGRPYSAYARVVIKNSYLDKTIQPAGWKIWSPTDPRTDHITFAEFNNSGPANWENNSAARLAFQNATLLTSDTYPLSGVMPSTDWIDMTYWNSISTPQPAVVTPAPVNTTVSGSSAYNGTVPPAGALVVSQKPIDGQTVYPTIQEALNAAPTSSKTNATIFIYPGTYNEQLIVAKAGTTIFMGYSDATDDYNQNQVTIQQSHGIDTQGDGSNVDGATVYATGNYFYAYNINFRNNNGTQQDIASLGFAVKSSKFAFMHGCQIYGNQDTLYISGSMFAFKSLIIGNVDFIFGSGLGYFLNSTIAPNEEGDSITAAKRATSTTAGGFIFDKCSVVPAPGVDASGWKNVSLGRPWNQYANVAYIDTYLHGMVGAAGWDQWSKSSPQTDGVSFGEYHNRGPGSSTCGRASFSKQLTDSEVVSYQL